MSPILELDLYQRLQSLWKGFSCAWHIMAQNLQESLHLGGHAKQKGNSGERSAEEPGMAALPFTTMRWRWGHYHTLLCGWVQREESPVLVLFPVDTECLHSHEPWQWYSPSLKVASQKETLVSLQTQLDRAKHKEQQFQQTMVSKEVYEELSRKSAACQDDLTQALEKVGHTLYL